VPPNKLESHVQKAMADQNAEEKERQRYGRTCAISTSPRKLAAAVICATIAAATIAASDKVDAKVTIILVNVDAYSRQFRCLPILGLWKRGAVGRRR
jgi:hypothetical protein